MGIYADVETSFAIIAEPNRRAILSLLAASERSVGEIERRLRMPQTSVSKHLRVLRDAGFVEARVEAQRRVYRSRPYPSTYGCCDRLGSSNPESKPSGASTG